MRIQKNKPFSKRRSLDLLKNNPTWKSTSIITHWPWHSFTSIWWCCIFLRILIKVFLWYNSLNINKTCIISFTYKDLLSFKFATSNSKPLILIKLKHREKHKYISQFHLTQNQWLLHTLKNCDFMKTRSFDLKVSAGFKAARKYGEYSLKLNRVKKMTREN